ncbi:MAG: hypothetical protein ACE5G9_08745 [Nitrospinales bacterium]
MKKTRIIVMTILLAFPVVLSAQNAMAANKARTALSPYFQTDAGSTYSFVGIAHPSLTSAATEIGLKIETIGQAGTAGSTEFTIGAGETYRVFIVSTNHPTVNSSTITGSKVLFLGLTNGSSTGGSLLFTSKATNPTVKQQTSNGAFAAGFSGLNQLAIWGAVVLPDTSSGFAMEFIGDAHDSAALAAKVAGDVAAQKQDITRGRGIN